jgi:hypothetical protein
MPDDPRVLPEVWCPLPMGSLDLGAGPPSAPPTPVVEHVVGGEVQAYCPSPRCTTDRVHTIISMFEDEIRRVQCVSCGEVHAFRVPRGGPAPAAVAKPSWDEAIAGFSAEDRSNAPPYSIRTTYDVNHLVAHPVFGVGVVVEILPDNKVEVVFQDRALVLVHAR